MVKLVICRANVMTLPLRAVKAALVVLEVPNATNVGRWDISHASALPTVVTAALVPEAMEVWVVVNRLVTLVAVMAICRVTAPRGRSVTTADNLATCLATVQANKTECATSASSLVT